jgi:hypothetical protein
MALVIHAGGWLSNEKKLREVEIPALTSTYVPVPYIEPIEMLRKECKKKGYQIKKESYALSKMSKRMFGVIDIDRGTSDEGWAIGIRNSYDKSISFGLCSGLRTFVCDNLAFSGDLLYIHRHTKGVSVEGAIEKVFNNGDLEASFDRRLKELEYIKEQRITEEEAAWLTLTSISYGVVPLKDSLKVMERYTTPKREFEEWIGTMYGWASAVTNVAQAYKPMRQMDTYMGLDKLLRAVR